jgi:hypothetical protein
MRRSHEALDQPEQNRGAELMLDQARQAHRDQEEQHDRQHERHDHGARPQASRDLLLLLRLLLLGRLQASARSPRPPARGSRSSATPPAPRLRGRSAGAARGGARAPSRGNELTSISPCAACPAARPPSLSCSADGLRTATAQLETPRIITPSSTACPPTGASRWAFSSVSESPPPSRSASAPWPFGSTGVERPPAARPDDIELLGGPSLR